MTFPPHNRTIFNIELQPTHPKLMELIKQPCEACGCILYVGIFLFVIAPYYLFGVWYDREFMLWHENGAQYSGWEQICRCGDWWDGERFGLQHSEQVLECWRPSAFSCFPQSSFREALVSTPALSRIKSIGTSQVLFGGVRAGCKGLFSSIMLSNGNCRQGDVLL